MSLAVTTYGSALNFIVRRLHSEHLEERFVSVPVSPGWGCDGYGECGGRGMWGWRGRALTVEESVRGQVKVIG